MRQMVIIKKKINGNYQEENLIRNGSFSTESGYQQGNSDYIIVTNLPLTVDNIISNLTP